MVTEKWYKPVDDFAQHLQYKKIRTRLLPTFEKACYEMKGWCDVVLGSADC
jgi:hypothetical protein